jgi:hypothetical protein
MAVAAWRRMRALPAVKPFAAIVLKVRRSLVDSGTVF